MKNGRYNPKLFKLMKPIGKNNVDEVQCVVEEYLAAGVSLDDSEGWSPLSGALASLALNGFDTRILKILIDNGADINAGSGDNIGDDDVPFIYSGLISEFLPLMRDNYEVAKIIFSSPTLKLEGINQDLVEFYEQIEAKKASEGRFMSDLEAVKAAHGGINSATIEPSFIPKKQVDAMMEYYSTGYKKKFSEKIFDDLAGQVVESLNKYIKRGWHQLDGVAKEFAAVVGNGEDQVLYTLPKDLIGLVGEWVNASEDVLDLAG